MATIANSAKLVDQTLEEYHADTARLSRSMLAAFAEDPALYEGRYITQTIPGPSSSAIDMGSVFHDIIAESDENRAVLIPSDCLSTSGAKAGGKFHEFAERHPGKILLKAEQWDSLQLMLAAVRRHPVAGKAIDGAKRYSTWREQTIHWTHEATGLRLRARPDVWLRTASMDAIWEVKTTDCVHPGWFARHAWSMGYYHQAAWYMDGVRALGRESQQCFGWIVVQRKPPHSVAVLEPASYDVYAAALENEQLLRDYAECKRSGVWRHKWIDGAVPLPRLRWKETLVDWTADFLEPTE